MRTLRFERQRDEVLRVLCLGAHSDDIEIGCGGTVLRLIAEQGPSEFYWVVFSGNAVRAQEARVSAGRFLKGAQASTVVIKDFRDSYFPYIGREVKEFCNDLPKAFSPDVVFTHHRQDLHQDHRLIAELTWNAFRDHLILEYEVAKYDGDLGQPNLFVPLSEATCRTKASHCIASFPSQAGNHWFTEEALLSLMRIRGIEANASEGFAEAFHARKVVI